MKAVLQIQTWRGSVLFLVEHVFTRLPEISMNDSHAPLPKSHQSGFCANSLNIGPAELVLGHHKLLQGGAGDFEKVTNNSNISALSQESTIKLQVQDSEDSYAYLKIDILSQRHLSCVYREDALLRLLVRERELNLPIDSAGTKLRKRSDRKKTSLLVKATLTLWRS
jgi:hypothetical protein